MPFLECPAETHAGVYVETAVEVMAAVLRLGFNLIAGYCDLGCALYGEGVLEAQIEFGAHIQTFVYIEVDACGGIQTEHILCVVGLALISKAVFPDLVVFISLNGASGKVVAVANLTACIQVDALVLIEVTLVAQVDAEVAEVALLEDFVMIGVGYVLDIAAADVQAEAEGVLVREEVAAVDTLGGERCAVALEG